MTLLKLIVVNAFSSKEHTEDCCKYSLNLLKVPDMYTVAVLLQTYE